MKFTLLGLLITIIPLHMVGQVITSDSIIPNNAIHYNPQESMFMINTAKRNFVPCSMIYIWFKDSLHISSDLNKFISQNMEMTSILKFDIIKNKEQIHKLTKVDSLATLLWIKEE